LTALVEEHARRTGSVQAKKILNNWTSVLSHFIKVYPHELKRVLGVERRTTQYSGVRELTAVAAMEVQRG
jgi:glutamate synthase domain-containing protein 3